MKNIIPSVARRLNLEKQTEEQKVCFLWLSVVSQIYGPEYHDKFKPLYLRNKTLFVVCPNSVWVNELQAKSRDLAEKINWEGSFLAV